MLEQSIANYARMGIDIEILEKTDSYYKVKIKQSRLLNGYLLNQKQLVERVKEIFEHTGVMTRVIPVVYSLQVDTIDLNWIKTRMQDLGIKRKDLLKQLAIDKSSLSLIFSGSTNLSTRTKATFFYYFLTYELNRGLRNQDLSSTCS